MHNKEQILKLIEKAERPLIIVGNGVRMAKAQGELAKFRLCSGIPFVTTWATKDMFMEGTPRLVGTFGVSATKYGNLAVQNADLIISLGCRLDTHMAGPDPAKFAPNAKKIIVDIDRAELEKHCKELQGARVHANVRIFLMKLNLWCWPRPSVNYFNWILQLEMWKKQYPICRPEYYDEKDYVNPYVFMSELSKATADGDIIITDAGATLTWTMQGYDIRHRQRLFSAFNHSPMGYALPAAIGAQYAKPDARVICIIGDGGMMMNMQELETLSYNKLPIRIFLMNNNGYGIIRQTQDRWLQGRHAGTGPGNGLGMPSFMKVAGAFGLYYMRIYDHSEIDEHIKDILNVSFAAKIGKPALCEVMIDPKQKIIPKLDPGKSLEEIE